MLKLCVAFRLVRRSPPFFVGGRPWRLLLALGAHVLLTGDRRRTSKPFALVIGYQLVVGHSPFVPGGMLVTKLSFSAFASRLLLCDPSPILGFVCAPRANLGRFSMFGNRLFPTLPEFTLALGDTSLFPCARESEEKREKNRYDYDGYNDDCPDRHFVPPCFV